MSASNDDAATAEAGAAGGPRSQEMYREKPVSTIVRVLTVMAYLTSVSFAAILLSVYYICIWKSPVLPKLDEENRLLARQGDHNEYNPDYPANVLHNLTGRSDIAVNDNSTETTIENLNFSSTETVESTDVLEGMETYTPTESSETENLTETTSLNIATVT